MCPRSRLSRAILLALVSTCLSLGACYRLEYKSTITVPPALLGAWDGSWTSQSGGGQGVMAMRLQTFDGRPVLQVDTSHTCLQGGSFQFTLRAGRFDVLRNGVPVFTAELDTKERRLAGSYGCPADRGSWSAEWSHELPPLGDVSGDWAGTFASSQPPTGAADFALHLDQAWHEGVIGVTGTLEIEGQPDPVPITSGLVFHSGNGFDLLLRTTVAGATFRVQGAGVFGEPASASGLAFVDTLSGSILAGAWTAERLPP